MNSHVATVLAINALAGRAVMVIMYVFAKITKWQRLTTVVGLLTWLCVFLHTPHLSGEPIGEFFAMSAGAGMVAWLYLYREFNRRNE